MKAIRIKLIGFTVKKIEQKFLCVNLAHEAEKEREVNRRIRSCMRSFTLNANLEIFQT